MGKVMILNASPRAPRSNSRQYAQLVRSSLSEPAVYFEVGKNNCAALWKEAGACSDLLLVFPLYADSLPATLLRFLEAAPESLPDRPTVSVLVNCGFLEAEQNDVAVEMVRLFAKQRGLPFGSVLEIGGGEAILNTPFRFIVQYKAARLARSICSGRHRRLRVTMPLPKKAYLAASEKYWLAYGARSGVSEEEMRTMTVEGK